MGDASVCVLVLYLLLLVFLGLVRKFRRLQATALVCRLDELSLGLRPE